MSKPPTTKEGRVNVPLGDRKKGLTKQALKAGTTETNLARILLLDGLGRLESGEFTVTVPAIAPVTPCPARPRGNQRKGAIAS